MVGVVGNVRHQTLEEEGGLEIYLPHHASRITRPSNW